MMIRVWFVRVIFLPLLLLLLVVVRVSDSGGSR